MRNSSRLSRAGRLLAAGAVAVAALAASLAISTPAFASPSGDLAAATNNARVAAGLPALQLDGQLSAVAQAWANKLAASNVLSHNGALRAQVSNWTDLGENVGMAGDIPSVQQAFMNSPEHRDNIMSPRYTLMGVGSATSTLPSCGCTVLWVVVDFKRPATTAAPAKPAAPAAPKTTPKAATTPAAPAQHATVPATGAPAANSKAPAPAAPPAPASEATQQATQATTETADPAAATPATTPATTATAPASAGANPSASASATALNTQLASAGSAGDPVSRVLTFASVMTQLPG